MLRAMVICCDGSLKQKLDSILNDIGLVSIVRTVDRYPISTELLRSIRACATHLIFLDVESVPKALELANLTLLGSIMARAALRRTESRGGHFRADFPTSNPAWPWSPGGKSAAARASKFTVAATSPRAAARCPAGTSRPAARRASSRPRSPGGPSSAR